MTTATPAERASLARAIALAGRARRRTAPNPTVGCVITVGGRVVGEGVTAPAGGPHAEIVALGAAGTAARGATAHVTLEPCSHHGRTPPCTQALIDAGLARVVIAHPDPNPLARGGAERLRAAGVSVVGPQAAHEPLRAAVAGQLEGFLTVVRHGRPHVTLKLAQTADGQLTAPPPHRWITGEPARRAVHRLRASVDAVLVGSGTIVADDPRLDVRHGVPHATPPRPIVLDGRLRTPPTARVVARGALIVTGPDAPVERRKALVDAGADVLEVPAGRSGGVELAAALEAIAATGVTSVLAEPGAALAAALLAAELVDRLILHVALGVGEGAPRRAVPRPAGRAWTTERIGGAGSDLILHEIPAPPSR